MGVNSLPKTVTRQRRGCDLNPGPSAPESSTLTTRLPSHPNCTQRMKSTMRVRWISRLFYTKFLTHTKIKYTELQLTLCEKVHQFLSRNKKRTQKEIDSFFLPSVL